MWGIRRSLAAIWDVTHVLLYSILPSVFLILSVRIILFCLSVILKTFFFFCIYHLYVIVSCKNIIASKVERLTADAEKQILWIQVSFTWGFRAKDSLCFLIHNIPLQSKWDSLHTYKANGSLFLSCQNKKCFLIQWCNTLQSPINHVILESQSNLWSVMKAVPQIPCKVSGGLFAFVS